MHLACRPDDFVRCKTSKRFTCCALDGEKHSPHWAWLYSRDIVVIDEISMLSASALHGVNHALNHVMSLSARHPARRETTYFVRGCFHVLE